MSNDALTSYLLSCDPALIGDLSSEKIWSQFAIMVGYFLLTGFWFFRKMGEKNFSSEISSLRFDLFKFRSFEKAVKKRYFSKAIRLVPALLFVLVLVSGFYGSKNSSFAANVTWLFWWTLLIFFVAFAGKIFCAVCPWDFFANLFQFGWGRGSAHSSQSFNLKWPKMLSNIYVAAGFFIVLTWLELGFDLTRNSYLTAWLGFAVVVLIILCALIFERRSFCRYACPVGRISGMYSQFSPIELRTKDRTVCETCVDKPCVRGTETTTPCPTSQIPYRLRQNTYCTLCTECIRSCDKDNLTLKIRPPGSDLYRLKAMRSDEGSLVVLIFALTFFHGLTMTPLWFKWTSSFSLAARLTYLESFTVTMALLIFICYLLFFIFNQMLALVSKSPKKSSALLMAFIPLVLGYHLGHNSMHLFGEVLLLLPSINDPFGVNWNLFGLNEFEPFALLNQSQLKLLQLTSIGIGFWYSLKVLRVRIEQMTIDRPRAMILFGSHYLVLLFMGTLALWFVYQPMAMRGGP